jgi:hypothetical protein
VLKNIHKNAYAAIQVAVKFSRFFHIKISSTGSWNQNTGPLFGMKCLKLTVITRIDKGSPLAVADEETIPEVNEEERRSCGIMSRVDFLGEVGLEKVAMSGEERSDVVHIFETSSGYVVDEGCLWTVVDSGVA